VGQTHLLDWRKNQENSKPLSEDLQRVLMDLVERIEKDSVPARSAQPIGFGEAAYVHIKGGPSSEGVWPVASNL